MAPYIQFNQGHMQPIRSGENSKPLGASYHFTPLAFECLHEVMNYHACNNWWGKLTEIVYKI
jgi:hypothetical protein